MEKGSVKSYDKSCGMGMIRRSSEVDVKFDADSIVAKDRVSLTQGDSVWFEVDIIKNRHIAINIRKA